MNFLAHCALAGLAGPPHVVYRKTDVLALSLSRAALVRLIAAIDASFARPQGGRAVAVAPGLYRDSRFYPAHGEFHLNNTCNTWTAHKLIAAGFAVSSDVIQADDLMSELSKIVRVLRKLDEDAPHSCSLVLDATVGQNAHSQVEIFKEMAAVTGLVVTKLDGTARGGVLVALAEKFGLPVHAVGVGEGEDDLRPFDATSFARNLMGLADAAP